MHGGFLVMAVVGRRFGGARRDRLGLDFRRLRHGNGRGRGLVGGVGIGGFGVRRAVRILRRIRGLVGRLVLRAPREPEAGP